QRLEKLGWSPRRIIVVSALLRGAYNTYQGVGPGLANLVMGLVFGEWYRRTRRTLPLVIAHTLLDVFAFVGYALLRDVLST
ncbi:MAG: CPBP family intramembrane metalloprotease, partial [Actinomycetales bacterium]|nr:CPBP family intramembrane metalloprotease [Actinomycetales bacterium]